MNMERGYMKTDENIYLDCRKKAAQYNEKLNSREMAAELLGVSVSTLANYELGVVIRQIKHCLFRHIKIGLL